VVAVALTAFGAGVLIMLASVHAQRRDRQRFLRAVLDVGTERRPGETAGEEDTAYAPVVEGAVAAAGRMVERIDPRGGLARALERAKLPVRPGEFVLICLSAGLVIAALLIALTGVALYGVVALVLAAGGGALLLRRRASKRRKAFSSQLPGALTLIASSLAAGHTFLRAIQMMTEQSDPPLSEEFGQILAETRLGDPVVDSLGRAAARLEIRDLDWVVQAIRIQQTVGGRLADLLHTLADYIRARDEVRREVQVLTAEGRMSAWLLGALPGFLLLATEVMNPGYMDPMYSGWGLVALLLSAGSVAVGIMLILRMSKVDV
jgi:tight adherence protein B